MARMDRYEVVAQCRQLGFEGSESAAQALRVAGLGHLLDVGAGLAERECTDGARVGLELVGGVGNRLQLPEEIPRLISSRNCAELV